MSKTDAVELDTLRFWLRPGDAAPARPAALFLALFSADPTDAGSAANELPAANGYARTAVSCTDPTAGNPVSNDADVLFPNPTANWPQATHVAVCKSNVHGTADLLYVAALDAPVTALTNVPIKFAAGALTFSED